MLGTDGFGNLLPFMPIKQDWFFKYVYRIFDLSEVQAQTVKFDLSVTEADFGDYDDVVMYCQPDYIYSTSYSYFELNITNSCGFDITLTQAYAQVYSGDSNEFPKIPKYERLALNDNDKDLEITGYGIKISNSSELEFSNIDVPSNSDLIYILLMFSKS